jgi:hypothetical protein
MVPNLRFAAERWVLSVRVSRACFGQTARLTRFIAFRTLLLCDSRIASRARLLGWRSFLSIDRSSDTALSLGRQNPIELLVSIEPDSRILAAFKTVAV